MRRLRTALHIVALTPLLIGCSETYWTSNVGETVALRPNTSLLTNADVRTVNRIEGFDRSYGPRLDKNDNVMLDHEKKPMYAIHYRSRQFVCAEPSPDVARVVQAALSAGATANVEIDNPLAAGLTGANSARGAGAARVDASRSEAVAQLTRRIATIQLLRDGLYRACEAYANGAIGPEIYTAIISRYDKMMITMLLAEMASSNLPGMASAGGAAAAGAAGDSAKLDEAVKVAQTALDAAQVGAEGASAAVLEAKTQKAEADTALANADAAGKPAALEAVRKKEAALEHALAQQKLADLALDRAKRTHGAAEQAKALGLGRAASAANAGITPTAGGAASVEVAQVLYKMQRAYLNDPYLGTQMLICAAEAAQPEPLRKWQSEQCSTAFRSAFSAEHAETVKARTVELQREEIRNERIALLRAALPANPSPDDLARFWRAVEARPAGR